MKTRPCYVVIDVDPGVGTAPIVKRVTKRWPQLEGGEIVARLQLEIPDSLMKPPLTVAELEESGLTLAVHVLENDPEVHA